MKHPPLARTMQGFTLTELMIVVVIVAILAAIGLPAYTEYGRRAKRADATGSLTQLMSVQERFFTDNNRYAAVGTELGYQNDIPESQEGFWALTITTNGAGTRTSATATPRNGHKDDDCAQITLDSAGIRSGKDSGNNDHECWGGR